MLSERDAQATAVGIWQPKVTIITVVYNSRKEFVRTIESVAEQSYGNVEYIVIDGGSTDGTLEEIRSNAHRITRWISEPDKGIYDAMNKGIMLATGDFVNFMNAGDIFVRPDTVEKVAHCLNRQDRLVYGSHLVQYPGKSPMRSKRVPPVQIKDIPKYMPFCHQSLFAEKSLLQKIKFDTSFRIAADYLFLCHSIAQGAPARRVDETIACITSGGLSDKSRHRAWTEYEQANSLYTGRKLSLMVFYRFQHLRELLKSYVKMVIGRQ